MKIGEFAKKHNVTIDTVRHYIYESLLTPLKLNKQYDFTDMDDDVMESILLLKSMNFKLEEMKPYMLFQTLYTDNSFTYLGDFKEQFLEKIRENQAEIDKLSEMNRRIEKQLNKAKVPVIHRGIALKLFSDFTCPHCDRNLELENPDIKHNEVMDGELICPDCHKKYYIRYGCISDTPIEPLEEFNDIKNMVEEYVQKNDDEYIVKVRELFTESACCVHEGSSGARTVFIDGQGCAFLNSPIIRSIPEDSTLFIYVYCRNNLFMKLLQEDILPGNVIFYIGDKAEIPYKVPMDYLFVQDYDVQRYDGGAFEMYPYISEHATLNCFKALIKNDNTFASETEFIEDMQSKGWQMLSVFKTGQIINKKSSPDMSLLNKNNDLKLQYAIYSFKTLG